MGIPKFFRWLSERYPKIIQRVHTDPYYRSSRDYDDDDGGGKEDVPRQEDLTRTTTSPSDAVVDDDGAKPSEEEAIARPQTFQSSLLERRFRGVDHMDPHHEDPLGTCTMVPEIDHLYIDVNGILHGCSHNGVQYDENANIAIAQVIDNVSLYLDRIVELTQPTALIYLAVDGVAPRAKLNQQRSRRYRAGTEGGINDDDNGGLLGEMSVYEKHFRNNQEASDRLEGEIGSSSSSFPDSGEAAFPVNDLHLVNGRWIGKVQEEVAPTPPVLISSSSSASTSTISGSGSELSEGNGHDDSDRPTNDGQPVFHSNNITPGTAFFQDLVEALQVRLVNDLVPRWTANNMSNNRRFGTPSTKPLQVILSGPNVPGEGEHKIMQFIREQQHQNKEYGRIRPCIVGQDGDLILLGLATHIPHLLLLREKVWFDREQSRRRGLGPAAYTANPCFEVLHFGVLRDYLAMELEVLGSEGPKSSYPWDLERTLDDVVFLSFFVGNDFLPHLPAMDIGDEGLDFLLAAYSEERDNWTRDKRSNRNDGPYLTRAGKIVSASRLEAFLSVLGSHEHLYHDYKRSTTNLEKQRQFEERYDQSLRTPSDDIILAKEEEDRKRYREMLASTRKAGDSRLNGNAAIESGSNFEPVVSDAQTVSERMSDLLRLSVASVDEGERTSGVVDDQDLKGRYYFDKFGFTPFDAEKHLALRKAYVEGLVWNLQYYYQGCASWEWYYPYHYGPMMSDLVGLEDLLSQVKFEMGRPLRPFEQLLACLPPSHAHLLPEPYRVLFEESSPISDFYPRLFTVDMNGKRLPWEAVVLLPFIDSTRLMEASETIDAAGLSSRELERNQSGNVSVISCITKDADVSQGEGRDVTPARVTPLEESEWRFDGSSHEEKPRFKPVIPSDVPVPLPGLATIRDGSVASLWRKLIRINVHGMPSRYKTACLELQNSVPEIIPLETVASQLIGTIIYINYPHLMEAFVTAVSDSKVIVRGKDRPRMWNTQEGLSRQTRMTRIVSRYVFGEKLVGSGGLMLAHQGGTHMEDLEFLLHVRPLRGVEPTMSGKRAKRFAKFEVEVPLFVTSWTPVNPDTRLSGMPALLEKDPYLAAKFVCTDPSTFQSKFGRSSKAPGTRPLLGSNRSGKTPSSISAHQMKKLSRGYCDSAVIHDKNPWVLVPPDPASFLPAVLRVRDHVHKLPPINTQQFTAIARLPPEPLMRRPFRAAMRPLRRGRIASLGLLMAGAFIAKAAVVFGAIDAHSRWEHTSAFGRATTYSTPPLEFAHGTTTVAFTFCDGIVVAVDSRASMGNFVGSKTTHKVLPIHSHMIGTMAGGAADCSFWIRKLQAEARLHEQMEDGRRMSVARASRLLSNALYANRGLSLSLGTMICGFDDLGLSAVESESERTPSPRIFYVDNSGMRIESDMFAVGSGSTYALGILDSEQIRRHDMTSEEAVALGIRAIRHATFRDAHSGGYINVYLITPEHGWRHVFSEDLASLPFREEKAIV